MTQPHAHSHGPQPQQPMMQPTPDPLLQAALDARFHAVPLKLVSAPGSKSIKVVPADPGSKLDFSYLNSLSLQLAAMLPENELVPPQINPQTVMQNPRSFAVAKAKDEGNVCQLLTRLSTVSSHAMFQKLYGAGKYAQAIQMYTTAAELTMTRPPWEASNLVKDELAMVLSNRSAAHAITNDWIAALADADAVVQIKRPWSKGHFRKAKALQGLRKYDEAKDALSLGLSFEPANAVSVSSCLIKYLPTTICFPRKCEHFPWSWRRK